MVVKLARPDDKDGVFNIAETAFTDISKTQLAVIVWPLSNPDLTLEGVVREISPVADPATRTYTVKVKPGIYFASDPAFKGKRRELTAHDYVFALKRLLDRR